MELRIVPYMRLKNLSKKYGNGHAPAAVYLNFFDRLFPRAPSPQPPHTDITLESFVFNYGHQIALEGYAQVAYYIELFMMPRLIQQLDLPNIPGKNLQHENRILAFYCDKTYQISVSPPSFYAFTILCLITIAWRY